MEQQLDYGEHHLQFHPGYLRQGSRGRCHLLPTKLYFHCHLIQYFTGTFRYCLVFPGKKKNIPHNPTAKHAGDSLQALEAPMHPPSTAVKRDNNETSPEAPLQHSAKRRGLCTLSGRKGSHRIPGALPDVSLGHEIQRGQHTKPNYTFL